MSRSGYSDSLDQWDLIRWRGAVASALRGRRGQAFLCEMLAALDALPAPRLIDRDLVAAGEVCALGAVARQRDLDVDSVDPDDAREVASAFGVAHALAAEVMHQNDDAGRWKEPPEDRWARMRAWVVAHLTPAPGGEGGA